MCRRRWYAAPDSARVSPNVRRVYMQSAAWMLSSALWQGQLLSLYLYRVFEGDMRSVGLAEGMQGLVRIASAVVIGAAVDKLPRGLLLRLASAVGLGVHGVSILLVLRRHSLGGNAFAAWLMLLSFFACWSSLQQTLVDVTAARFEPQLSASTPDYPPPSELVTEGWAFAFLWRQLLHL